jgi:DNA polymerase-1
MTARLMTFPEALQFQQERGRPINFGSNKDLADLFFNILQLPKGKQTAGGADCVDAAVLATLNTPIAKEITSIAKTEKLNSTYLTQFWREICDDGRIHPVLGLNQVATYRSGASNPNVQNLPSRDKEALNIARSGIFPEKGHMLVDWDYSSLEVRIIACYTQDSVLMNYIKDETSDMHKDQAMILFGFAPNEWAELDKKHAKAIRFEAKNGLVFPLFYGSFYGSISRNLFPKLKEMTTGEMTVFEHLRSKGIINSLSSASKDFEEHVKQVEKKFWTRFSKSKLYQEQSYKDYVKNGYVEQKFGFKGKGWMSKNDISNHPVQGSAFHCLLWSLNELDRRMKAANMESKIITEIHDCCLASIVPDELEEWCKLSYEIATQEIRKAHPWIIVPLDLEFSKSEVDGSWATMKEFHPFK